MSSSSPDRDYIVPVDIDFIIFIGLKEVRKHARIYII